MLVCVIVQNVPARVHLYHVLKFRVDDKVDCISERLSKMKFYSQVTLFYKLKMVTRAVIWGQVKTERCVARAVITSIYLISHILGKLSSARKKTLKASYKILTPSHIKFQKQGFSRYLFSVHVHAHLSEAMVFEVKWIGGICPVILRLGALGYDRGKGYLG